MDYASAQRTGIGRDLPTIRMLVVDDVPEICALFRRLVRRVRTLRVELVTEINSQRALELLRQEAFDLVVSDFRMREVNGIDVLRAAREKNPHGRRLLVTGYNEIPARIEDIRLARVDAYLQKPLADSDLVEVIMAALNQDEAALAPFREHARRLEAEAEREARQLAPGE